MIRTRYIAAFLLAAFAAFAPPPCAAAAGRGDSVPT